MSEDTEKKTKRGDHDSLHEETRSIASTISKIRIFKSKRPPNNDKPNHEARSAYFSMK